MRSIATALGAYHATYSTFAQCTLGASAQKWTTIAGAGGLARILASLRAERYLCPHGRDGHSEVLSGRDALGRSRTGEAAAYPEPLNALLTRALLAAATERRLRASSQHTGTSEPLPPLRPALPTIHEGRVGAGIAMGILAHASCESARHFPNRFAHSSLHIPETQASLRAEPFPGELSSPVTSSRPASACKAHRRRRLPHSAPLPGAPDTSCEHIGCCPTPSPPIGPAHIAIANLFLPGVYASQVLDWFVLADSAAAAIRAGKHPPSVPTRVIGQHSYSLGHEVSSGIAATPPSATQCGVPHATPRSLPSPAASLAAK